MIIRPQPGPQEMFASSHADIAFYGGSAGSGKSFGLLLEPTRFVNRRGFGGVIFRRTSPEITNEGGLWDTSEKIYSHIGGEAVVGDTYWRWPTSGVTIAFSHMQHEKDKLKWQGAAIPFIGFDEVTHFTKTQFFYLISRNRLTHACNVRPWVRATCNPEPDSWVTEFISWWLNPDTGFPIPERAGKLRWFIRNGDDILWANKAETLMDLGKPGVKPKSVTFVPSKLTDNPILMEQDPDYLSNLHALPMVDRMRLLDGNWKVRAIQGMIFKRQWFGKPISMADLPKDKFGKVAKGKIVRYWDRAATEVSAASPDPDWTVGVKMMKVGTDYFVLDVVRTRGTPNHVLKFMKATAAADGYDCEQVWEEDPGAAGKAEIAMLYREFQGTHASAVRVTKAKVLRAKPASSQVEAGNIKLVKGAWNEAFLSELEAFADWDEVTDPPPVKPHDDQVDAFSGAFTALTNNGIMGRGNF